MERENIFSINLDDEKLIDREEFIIRRESAAVSEERKKLNDRMFKTAMKGVSKSRSILHTATVVCIYIGIRQILDYIDTKEFSVFGILAAMVGLIICLIFQIAGKVSKKKNESRKGDLDKEYDDLCRISEGDLNIPASAKTVDIFTYLYDANGQHNEAYANEEVKVFEENGMLCIYFFEAVVGIPIESVEAIVECDYPVEFTGWNKDIPYDSEEYERFDIIRTDEDTELYYMDGFYLIRFASDGKPYELMVPTYDIQPFLEILKLEVTGESV